MNNPIIYENQELYLSCDFLRNNSIRESTIERWIDRKSVNPFRIKKSCFILYDEIPTPTKLKLPSKADLIAIALKSQTDAIVEDYYNDMNSLKQRGFAKYAEHYTKKYDLPAQKLLEFTQLHAVWQYIIDLKQKDNCRDLERLYRAFSKLYPGKYNTKHSFSNAIKKAVRKGIESVSFDKRIYSAPQNVKRISKVQTLWTMGLISIGKKYSNRQVWEKLCAQCQKENVKPPSLSWVDKYRTQILKKNINIFESRYGKQDAFAKKLPYASTYHAQYPNDQWQMDGWTLPFWGAKFQRYTMVIVRDSFSKMIVGSACGTSENTKLIMEALGDAISNTESLTTEIVTDNHAFNQTKEAEYLKEETEKMGVTWTVTSNPRHKSIIERYNKHLDTLCREYTGYLGEGIKSKNVDARPKQELIDQYAKEFLSEREIKLISLEIVEKWNKTANNIPLISPFDLYTKTVKPHSIQVNMFDRVRILTSQTELKVNRGQLTIKRAGLKYEYQLPADLYGVYNDKVVLVRYEDYRDCIYLYDKQTKEPITVLKQKGKIHGAKINQTEKDKELLFKNKGRIEGIKSKAKKQVEQLTSDALKENPEAVHILNSMTEAKNVLREAEQNCELKRKAQDSGIDLKMVCISERANEIDNELLQPVSKKKESPFTPKNHKISIVNTKDLIDSD